jgi:hypothetical protein
LFDIFVFEVRMTKVVHCIDGYHYVDTKLCKLVAKLESTLKISRVGPAILGDLGRIQSTASGAGEGSLAKK